MTLLKKLTILISDIILLYLSLGITLFIRYGNGFSTSFKTHLIPFSFIFVIWILILYLSDFYSEKFLKINFTSIQRFYFTMLLCLATSIALFYLFESFFRLTPKTNLFIFIVIFSTIELLWRIVLSKIFIFKGWRKKILTIGEAKIILELETYFKAHPQIGFDIVAQEKNTDDPEKLKGIIQNFKIDILIIQPLIKKGAEDFKTILRLFNQIHIADLITFYEAIFKKIPIDDIDEIWALEKINLYNPFYKNLKKFVDFSFSLILIIILSPLFLIISALIKITSPGPVIFKQERMGFKDKPFTLYKFRTMVVNDGKKQWDLWTNENDSRLTLVGKFLRNTHLDEIPQLYNILSGDISFIGPRAERVELAQLYNQLPYYNLRHIIKPGLTGWAQINYKPSASVEEAKEKLKYDLYYIKNASFIIDIIIIIKTIRYLFFILK